MEKPMMKGGMKHGAMSATPVDSGDEAHLTHEESGK